jgi:very-short-patch-repair endonuclease
VYFIFLLLLIIVIAVIGVLITKSKFGKDHEVWPFYPRKPLSNPEQILYFRLLNALPDHIILAQVQLSRFLGVKKGNNFQSWLNRINRLSADYVICSKDASVVAVIELDDASHSSSKRQETDSKKDKAIRDAGLKIIRWNVKAIPSEDEIKNLVAPVPQ